MAIEPIVIGNGYYPEFFMEKFLDNAVLMDKITHPTTPLYEMLLKEIRTVNMIWDPTDPAMCVEKMDWLVENHLDIVCEIMNYQIEWSDEYDNEDEE